MKQTNNTKIKIEIETSNYKDIRKIGILLGAMTNKAKVNNDYIQKTEQPNNSEEINKDFINKKKFPAIRGQSEETIIKILQHIESGTVIDISSHTDMKLSTIRPLLSVMKRKKIVDSSTTIPLRYFLRGKDPELNDMLKNVKRRGSKDE